MRRKQFLGLLVIQAKLQPLLSSYSSAITILLWVSAVLTTLTNLVLIIVILSSQELRKERHNHFMISLTCADLLVGSINIPFNTIRCTEVYTDTETGAGTDLEPDAGNGSLYSILAGPALKWLLEFAE